MTARVAIVTGAGRGIGAAIARTFAEKGMRVAVLDVDEGNALEVARSIDPTEREAVGLRCDVSKRVEVEAAIAAVTGRLGFPGTLVNNAAVGGPFHRIDEVSDEEWDWIIGTNLKSVFLFCRALLPKMKAAGYGRIVNIASVQGLLGSARSSTYVASKHGMIGYTKTIAAEWGEFGITCNAICPGYVDTAMGVQPDKIPEYMQAVLRRTPVKRTAAPLEIASLAAFLADPANGYINGASFVIDGGISADVGIT